MLRPTQAFVLCSLLSSVAGLGIIFPDYIYPGDGCSAWEPISSAIGANPDVPFYIIINPNSGPVPSPDSNYQACIPTLRPAGTQAKVLGYVPTGFGGTSISDVEASIDEYFAWGASYRPDGIFLDEVITSASFVDHYATLASYGKNHFEPVVFNPGTTPESDAYFTSADLIVTFENAYSTFSTSDLSISSSAPAAKQAVILYSSPSTPPPSFIDQLGELGVGFIYLTDDGLPNPYDTVPSGWTQEVDDVASA
ncbi:Spherulation-specific family 4 [Gloeopeniophorella convolvens]|nr:Spherulation-specific family 4 [Gloeopeniophorella convolvens]